MDKKGRKRPFKIIGELAHQSRPKKKIDFKRTIWAYDAVHAMKVVTNKLRGVKKRGIVSVIPL